MDEVIREGVVRVDVEDPAKRVILAHPVDAAGRVVTASDRVAIVNVAEPLQLQRWLTAAAG